jgi:DNA-binding NarL/FixJ family response regulator
LALAAYREHQPAWVLMDIQMTVMDGLEATREIIAAFPLARIIIVTQHGDPQTRASALQNGACAFLLKDDLLKLREFISNSQFGGEQ